MNSLLTFIKIAPIATDDYVGFTFFVGCMAMMAASVFFFPLTTSSRIKHPMTRRQTLRERKFEKKSTTPKWLTY